MSNRINEIVITDIYDTLPLENAYNPSAYLHDFAEDKNAHFVLQDSVRISGVRNIVIRHNKDNEVAALKLEEHLKGLGCTVRRQMIETREKIQGACSVDWDCLDGRIPKIYGRPTLRTPGGSLFLSDAYFQNTDLLHHGIHASEVVHKIHENGQSLGDFALHVGSRLDDTTGCGAYNLAVTEHGAPRISSADSFLRVGEEIARKLKKHGLITTDSEFAVKVIGRDKAGHQIVKNILRPLSSEGERKEFHNESPDFVY